MNHKIINKILDYISEKEFANLIIFKKNNKTNFLSDNGHRQEEINIPFTLKEDISLSFKKLISISPKDLSANTYFKHKNDSFRISIIPNEEGEKVIINRVTKDRKKRTLSQLGLGRKEKIDLIKFINKKRALIVIASPENEGKSTSLLALINHIDQKKVISYALFKHATTEIDNVITINGNNKKRLDYLEKISKHDSDLIAIDDADDSLIKKSVEISNQGRLVILAIKADSINQVNEKISKHNKYNLPIIIIFQKLLSKNCPYCLKSYVNDEIIELINNYWPKHKNYQPSKFFNNKGCLHCNHSGKNGNIAVFNITYLNNNTNKTLAFIHHDILQKASNGLISISKLIKK